MTEEYNTDNMPNSEHYRIEAMYNQDVGRATYFAVNKETGVPEVPFILASDASYVLKDLESYYDSPKGEGKVSKLSTIQH